MREDKEREVQEREVQERDVKVCEVQECEVLRTVASDIQDNGRDVAICCMCRDRVIISDMYYRDDYRWKLVRDHRHLWVLIERSIPAMCRWCKCEYANTSRLLRTAAGSATQ